MRRYTGEDLGSIPYDDLDQLELELESSVNKVRDRKVVNVNQFLLAYCLMLVIYLKIFLLSYQTICLFLSFLFPLTDNAY